MLTEPPRVLCGTDFSVHAAEAASVAAAMAQRLNQPVHLVHVAATPGVQGTEARLHEEADRLRALGVDVRESVVSGSPYEQLVQQANTGPATFIVVASLGHIAPSRFLVGSTAERTAELATVPTLVVRGSSSLLAWLHGESSLNICIGCDFSETSDAALQWVSSLLRIGPCNVTAVHLWWPAGYHPYGRHADTAAADASALVQQEIDAELRDRISRIFPDSPVRTRVEPCWGRVDMPLLTIANQEHADLIVVGSHQRHGMSRLWLGSVSRAVLHAAPVSVAVVPMARRKVADNSGVSSFRCVVVATDLTEPGNRAISFGYASVAPGGQVWLVHVVAPLQFPSPLVPHYSTTPRTEKTHAQHINTCMEILHRLVPEESTFRSIHTEVQVIESASVEQSICEVAQKLGADLICMASQSRSSLSAAILGSVAQKVLSHSACPVLMVPPNR